MHHGAHFLGLFFVPGMLCQIEQSAKPDQVHISFGETASTIVVTWSTTQKAGSVVEYGIGGLTKSAEGFATEFVDGGVLKKVRFIHRVELTDLKPHEEYVYRCGSELGWSEDFSFKTVDDFSEMWTPSVVFYGDLGVENAKSFPFIAKDAEENRYDAILHVGDIGYDMCYDNGAEGDKFMKMIEPVATKIPYMTCPGNHEAIYNFSHYRNRFSMPGHTEGLFYSFNLGMAHFISLDSEAYYYFEQLKLDSLLRNQHQWLEDDLKKATSREERAKRPWIITYAHSPMYCSNRNWLFGAMDCLNKQNAIRVGVDLNGNKHIDVHFPVVLDAIGNSRVRRYGLEELFMKYGVDLSIWGHLHAYERSWPVYNYTIYNGSYEEPYKNPRAPVHIISGAAGSREGLDSFAPEARPFSAFRNEDYGYGRLKIHNATHLHVEQVSVDCLDDKGDGTVIDEIWLIQEHHGPHNAARRTQDSAN